MVCDLVLVGHLDVVRSLCIADDQIISGAADYKLKVWSVRSGKAVFSIDEAHIKTIRTIEYVSSRQLILSGGGDGIMKVWTIHKGYLRNELLHGSEITVIKFLLDEYLNEQVAIVATGGTDRQIVLWNLDTGVKMKILSGHHESVQCLAYNKQLNLLISGGSDKTIRLWEPFEARQIKSIKAHNDLISSVQIQSDRLLAITGSWDKTIRIVSIEYLMKK